MMNRTNEEDEEARLAQLEIDNKQLYNVHMAMTDAVAETEERERNPERSTFTFKLSKADKTAAHAKAKMHGTTLAAFLRKCVEGLLKDYGEQE